MALLILGIAIWAVVHFVPALGVNLRAGLIERLGPNVYKASFALLVLLGLALIIIGWRSTPATSLWLPPLGLRHATMALMPIAVILFIAARLPTDLKRVIRHPQLTGVKLWAVAHLLSNGEMRSVVLFGGLLAWAVIEVIVINRREGAWQKPVAVGALKTTVSTVLGLIITAVLVYVHPWLSGQVLIAH